MKYAFLITEEQIAKIRPFLNNIDVLLFDYDKFQSELDQAIVEQLDEEYNATPNSRMLQNIYDAIYDQNG